MTANTAATRKAKGRNASLLVRDMILEKFPVLSPDDVIVKPSGVIGEDLYLSPHARSLFPYCVEVKCQEKLNIWDALEQVKQHEKKTGYKGLLIFKRNHTDLYVCYPFKYFK